jgi:hypothetical protein
MERPLGELRLCAVLIDGTPFKDRQIIVALGIGCDGTKTVLGIREGAKGASTATQSCLSESGLHSRPSQVSHCFTSSNFDDPHPDEPAGPARCVFRGM